MTKRYVRPTIAGWLVPSLLAPWISVVGVVTAFSALGVSWGIVARVATWLLGMLVGGLWTIVYCTMCMVADVALLAVRARTLPTGTRGWTLGLAAPVVVFACYAMWPPYSFWRHCAWGVALATLAPMLVAVIVSRWVGGEKLPAGD